RSCFTAWRWEFYFRHCTWLCEVDGGTGDAFWTLPDHPQAGKEHERRLPGAGYAREPAGGAEADQVGIRTGVASGNGIRTPWRGYPAAVARARSAGNRSVRLRRPGRVLLRSDAVCGGAESGRGAGAGRPDGRLSGSADRAGDL